jgi:hypothetical protein
MIISKYINPFDLYPDSEFSSPEEYMQYVSTLPATVREVLTSDKTGEFIGTKIKSDFNLNDAQVTQVTAIIRDVLLANLMLKDFVEAIKVEVPLEEKKAIDLANLAVSQLFNPAINELKELHKREIDNISKGIVNRPTPKPPPDPIVDSQKVSGTLNLRGMQPANLPSLNKIPPSQPAPAQNQPSPAQPYVNKPVQPPVPAPKPQSQPIPPPFQPTYTPKPPVQPVQPQSRPPEPPPSATPSPVPTPPPQPKTFKMPPPLGSTPAQPPPNQPKSELQHNINADKVIDLRDLENNK